MNYLPLHKLFQSLFFWILQYQFFRQAVTQIVHKSTGILPSVLFEMNRLVSIIFNKLVAMLCCVYVTLVRFNNNLVCFELSCINSLFESCWNSWFWFVSFNPYGWNIIVHTTQPDTFYSWTVGIFSCSFTLEYSGVTD